MIFLPKTDLAAQEAGRAIIESEILDFGYGIYGWRQVPIDTACIGEKANATRPEIEQIMVRNRLNRSEADFERDLYVIRRRIEKAAAAAQVDLYVCSLSCRSLIYKGMFLAENLTDFYPDLLDERFVSRFAIYHQRYSTNTFPTWKLAQPSVVWRITAKSIRSQATSTGCAATRPVSRMPNSTPTCMI